MSKCMYSGARDATRMLARRQAHRPCCGSWPVLLCPLLVVPALLYLRIPLEAVASWRSGLPSFDLAPVLSLGCRQDP